MYTALNTVFGELHCWKAWNVHYNTVNAEEDENQTQSRVLLEGQGNAGVGPQNHEKVYKKPRWAGSFHGPERRILQSKVGI